MSNPPSSTQKSADIALVVHGHFYQPPRENPWTDEVGREPSAAPFVNWNARIHAECYRANAYARIYGDQQQLSALVNNYGRMSVDLGPTLARWIERHDPHVLRRMRQGDEEQRTLLGGGGAMAHVWGHPIAPLLSVRDLKTQILWGKFDFQARFGRDPQGMWLPETAADPKSLAALMDAGIAFTIVAPEQIEAVRAPNGAWQEVGKDTIDTGRLYRYMHPDGSGRSLAIAIFDGPLSRDLAFGQATRDAGSFLSAIQASATRSKVEGKKLVLAASDGELYGHHKKFADLTLAYATRIAASSKEIEITNIETLLAKNPPTWELRFRPGPNGEGTAWSCGHGVGRWLRDCGCRMLDAPGNKQSWRGPLRKALDHLRDEAVPFFEADTAALFVDPWTTRDAYGEFVDAPATERKMRLQALGKTSLRSGRGNGSERALMHMEMQRSLLLMYASCAWFFDDIAGPEAALAIRRAGHAMDIWRDLGGTPPEAEVLDLLAKGRSNLAKQGNGADAYRRAMADRITPAQVVACAAFERLAGDSTTSGTPPVPGHLVTLNVGGKPSTLCKGVAEVETVRIGKTFRLPFSATYDGQAGFSCVVGKETILLSDLRNEFGRALRFGALVRMASRVATAGDCQALIAMTDSLVDLSPDEQQALHHLQARALVKLLNHEAFQTAVEFEWALRLAKCAGLPLPTDDGQRVQERVWETIENLRNQKKKVPKPLAKLAVLLGFAPQP